MGLAVQSPQAVQILANLCKRDVSIGHRREFDPVGLAADLDVDLDATRVREFPSACETSDRILIEANDMHCPGDGGAIH